MRTLEETTTTVWGVEDETFDEAQLAAVAFLARYSGRTLDAYRHDLRAFFQWATDKHLIVLKATRPHIELYRAAMEERGLAASTIDRRLSTVCGFYRFAHIDGRIAANPAQYVRRPKVHPSQGHGMDRAELGRSCSPPNVSIAITPRWPCCSASTAATFCDTRASVLAHP
jgi:site-specific recombinase XerD